MRYKPVINTIYNDYVVISEETQSSSGGTKFHVRCACGREEFKLAKHLVIGRCKRCRSCASKLTAKNYPPPRNIDKMVGNLGSTYYTMLKFGAQKRNLEFNVSQEYLWNLFINQNKTCALSGLPINLSTKTKQGSPDYSLFTASLDRIDNTIGYVEGNVQWVHKELKRLRGSYSITDFIELCILVADYQRDANQQPS